MKVDMTEEMSEDIALGELAKLYMADISEHFLVSDNLTKRRFLQIEEDAIIKFKETLENSKL